MGAGPEAAVGELARRAGGDDAGRGDDQSHGAGHDGGQAVDVDEVGVQERGAHDEYAVGAGGRQTGDPHIGDPQGTQEDGEGLLLVAGGAGPDAGGPGKGEEDEQGGQEGDAGGDDHGPPHGGDLVPRDRTAHPLEDGQGQGALDEGDDTAPHFEQSEDGRLVGVVGGHGDGLEVGRLVDRLGEYQHEAVPADDDPEPGRRDRHHEGQDDGDRPGDHRADDHDVMGLEPVPGPAQGDGEEQHDEALEAGDDAQLRLVDAEGRHERRRQRRSQVPEHVDEFGVRGDEHEPQQGGTGEPVPIHECAHGCPSRCHASGRGRAPPRPLLCGRVVID